MHELSLFSGAGGGLLGTNMLGWRPIGYVEINDYCQRVLAARIKDGLLHEAPIFSDIKTFLSDGYARRYRGMVDIVTAGFPCPAYSQAARGRNRPEKDLWNETAAVIEEVRPSTVLLENVVRIRERLPSIGRDLVGMGFSLAPIAQVSAASMGAPHRRDRIWIVAYANGDSECHMPLNVEMVGPSETCRPLRWREFDSRVLGMDDGMAHRMDRLRAIGNGQVAMCVPVAWNLLRKGVEL